MFFLKRFNKKKDNEIKCSCCGKNFPKSSSFFYEMRNRELYTPECKDCIKKKIVWSKTETFLPYLEKFDYPYLEDEWYRIADREIKKEYFANLSSILGKYISLMKLYGYRVLSFENSKYIEKVKENK